MNFNVKKYFQVLGVAFGVIFLAFMVVMGFDFTGGTTKDNPEAGIVAAGDEGTINILLMCTDNDGLRTDAIMLASYNTQTNNINMLSIPRDLRMYIGNRYQKINAAHAFYTDGVPGGPTATCEAVSRLTGVAINYYVDFSFSAIAQIIDELGAINFTIPDIYGDGVGMVYDDPYQDLHINLPPGTYDLNGEQVVHLLRYRKGNPDPITGIRKTYPGGDADRIKIQQEFIRSLIDQKLNLALIKKIPSIFSDVKREIKTNFTVKDILKYSKYLKNISSTGINSLTVPCDATHDSANGDVYVPNMNKLKDIICQQFGGTGDNMWYAAPGEQPKLFSSGYMTVGGYVRSTDSGVLSGLKATEATNDELCLIRGIDQSDDVEEGVVVE